MEDKFFVLWFVTFLCILSACLGNYNGSYKYLNLRDNCEKSNNVYECELIAVPKGETK